MDHLLKMFRVEQKTLQLLGEQVDEGEVDQKILREALLAGSPNSTFISQLLNLLDALDNKSEQVELLRQQL